MKPMCNGFIESRHPDGAPHRRTGDLSKALSGPPFLLKALMQESFVSGLIPIVSCPLLPKLTKAKDSPVNDPDGISMQGSLIRITNEKSAIVY